MFGNTNPGMLLPPQVIERYTTTTATDHVLSSTGVRAGQVFWIINRTANSTVLTIKSSDGDSIETIRYGRCVLMALQDNPTDATHWDVVEVYEEGNWTPVLREGTNVLGGGSREGIFFRQNSWVTINWAVSDATISGAGAMNIIGMPYNIASTASAAASAFSWNGIDLNNAASPPQWGVAAIWTSADQINYVLISEGVTGPNILASIVSTGHDCRGQNTYKKA